ncbi:MAG TPA: hypothetical protein VED20_10915 [Streptosporangiaceae bacterium]|nr:hypothetical protein [Streptosporangiaceae bacterium]
MSPDGPVADSRSPLLHPFRLTALAGVVGVVVGVFGPWVQGTLPDGSVTTYNGFAGAADGLLQLVFCAALVLLLRSRAAGESQTLVVSCCRPGPASPASRTRSSPGARLTSSRSCSPIRTPSRSWAGGSAWICSGPPWWWRGRWPRRPS